MVEKPQGAVENEQICCSSILKLVGAFLPSSATRVRKNRSAIRGLISIKCLESAEQEQVAIISAVIKQEI